MLPFSSTKHSSSSLSDSTIILTSLTISSSSTSSFLLELSLKLKVSSNRASCLLVSSFIFSKIRSTGCVRCSNNFISNPPSGGLEKHRVQCRLQSQKMHLPRARKNRQIWKAHVEYVRPKIYPKVYLP